MAQTVISLSVHFTPAFHEMMNTAEAIKDRWGEERAIAWVQKTLEADFDLFCNLKADQKPSLRLITGGLA
jgi:hypothetical protein